MDETRNADYAALILRLGLGVMFIAHGLLKVLVFTMPGTVGFFESQGFPGFLAYVTVFGEVGGGAALVLGIQVRWISLALAPILLGAAKVHMGNGWLFTAQGGGWEYPVFLIIATVTLALLGNGAYAFPVPWAKRAEAVSGT